jgi:hypothetical protein
MSKIESGIAVNFCPLKSSFVLCFSFCSWLQEKIINIDMIVISRIGVLQATVTALCKTGIRILSLDWPGTAKLVIV